METEVYTANVRIKNLPKWVNDKLATIATQRQCNKVDVIRDALQEYAERHGNDN